MALAKGRSPTKVPPWILDAEPLTTGMLGQAKTKVWFQDDLAVGIRASSVIYPVFPRPVDPKEVTVWTDLLTQVAPSWCLMGPNLWVQNALPLMPISQITNRLDYQFLAREATPMVLSPGLGVARRTGPSDFDALYPLHEAYEKEEVLLRPADFHPLASRLHFLNLLGRQPSAALFDGAQALAKTSANAATSRWVQLGGVFTPVPLRRQGLQKRLLSWFLNELADRNQGACLFVKSSNVPALELYRALGFHSLGAFTIVYGYRHSVVQAVP